MKTWLDVQRKLKERGYNPGPLDGIYGRLTRAAVAAFQHAEGLDIKWPGTVDLKSGNSKTLKRLFGSMSKDETVDTNVILPWISEARKVMGLHEVYNYKRLSDWLRINGGYLGDPRRLPWCGDFVESAIAKTLPEEPMIQNPYGARNWARFGVKTDPYFGCIAYFWRGSRNGWQGHVGFLVGENAKNYQVLGGNQSNRVSVAPLVKYRLLGCVWPKTHENPKIKLPYMNDYGKVSWNEA